MPVHEVGHAVVGWICGYNSVPTLWQTIVPRDQGFIAPVILFGGICYLINYARINAHGGLFLAGVILLGLQFTGTFILEKQTANSLITWGGDGVGMILAMGLMAAFRFDKRTGWYKGYLRWGFAFIGAAAFADMVSPWWVSLNDISAVPYGQSGGNHTDTYKLMNYHGWSMDDVIHRYVALSVVCMVILAIFCANGIRQAGKLQELLKESVEEDPSDS